MKIVSLTSRQERYYRAEEIAGTLIAKKGDMEPKEASNSFA